MGNLKIKDLKEIADEKSQGPREWSLRVADKHGWEPVCDLIWRTERAWTVIPN